jgi:glycosyltransferase involved in cell wall biosynthesis
MMNIQENDIQLVRESPHFDAEWYANYYKDVGLVGLDPVYHFLWLGWRLGRRPSEKSYFQFDLERYLEVNPEVLRSGMHPVAHYLVFGLPHDGDPSRASIARQLKGDGLPDSPRQPSALTGDCLEVEKELVGGSPLFDEKWYNERYPEAALAGYDALTHFLVNGAAGFDPSAYFSSSFYIKRYKDVERTGCNPLVHYLHVGHKEGRSPHPEFDTDWYRRRYLSHFSDVEPLTYYLTVGNAAGHRPHPFFDGASYLDRYPDLQNAGVDPYPHWIKYGRAEGRQGIGLGQSGSNLKVAVVAHVFYEDLWPEISLRLHALPEPFDLIVTVSPGSTLAKRVLASWPRAEIREVPNSGRDIGPFLRILPSLLQRGYDVVCKIHTKRGGTEPDTWRHMLLEGVLGSKAQVRQILGWFENDPDLATVGPSELYLDGERFIGPNAATLASLFRRIEGPIANIPSEWGFFAGSMFWIRPEVLTGLATLNLLSELEEDNNSNDGQVAHAVERLFGLLATSKNCRIGLTDVSGGRATTFVDVQPAPSRTIFTELAETLPSKRQEFAPRIPSLKRAKRRAWLAPHGVELGVTFLGPVEAINGLGVSARGFVDAAIATGLPVHVIKWRPGFDRVRMQDVDVPTPGEQVINLIHLNFDLMHAARLLDQEPFESLMSPQHYNIAIISWELLAVNPDWADTIHRFDEIWASSSYMVRAIQSVAAVPVRLVRPAINLKPGADPAPLPLDIPSDRVAFLYCTDFGSVVQRKNPEAFWRAYAEEFTPDDKAICIVKIHYVDKNSPLMREIEALAQSRSDVILITDSLTDGEMETLFARADCYVSPHRAEGLGLTLLEAMLAGKPVIATGFSGEGDFVREDTALLLEYDLIEVGVGAEPYMAGAVWADPKHDSLRRRMRQVLEDIDAARNVGMHGRRRAKELFSLEHTSRRLKDELTRIWRNGGGRLDEKAE